MVRTDVIRRGLKILWIAVRAEPRIFLVSFVGSVLFSLATVAMAFVTGAIIGRVVVPAFETGRVEPAMLAVAVGTVFGITVLRVAGILGRRLGAGIMQYRLQATYRRQVIRKYLELPLAWHQRHPTGALLSNANSDIEALWFPIAPFPFAAGVVVMVVVAGVAMLATDWAMALVGLAVFPAILALNLAYSRRMSPRMTQAQALRAEVAARAHESFDGALVVKTLGRESAETDRFGAVSGDLRDALVRVGRVRGLFDPLMEVLPNVGILLILILGAARAQSGAIGITDVVSMAFLFTMLAFPLRAVGWLLGELPRSVVGWDRVRAVLDATGELPYGQRNLTTRGPAALSLEGVTFAYQSADSESVKSRHREPVLRDVNLDIPPGRTVALVGPTGSGKSTLTALVARLVDVDAGAVLLDGVDVRALAPGEVSRAVALVPQTAFLFDDTVRGNVTLEDDPRPDATDGAGTADNTHGASVDPTSARGTSDDAVWAALRLAQADRFVAALPNGLDTLVGERGARLSGGQRQRLTLARALVRRPRLLILDDSTSSVDPTVEAAILRSLHHAELGASLLVVAYRRATIALADEVIYLDQGGVVARGTHVELLASLPAYQHLVKAYEEAEQERARERAFEAEQVGVAR